MDPWDDEVTAAPCALCSRVAELEFHHLIPRCCHSNKWFRKRFRVDAMRSRGLEVCGDCHKYIHKLYSEKELGRNFNTLEALLADEALDRFLKWIRKR